MDPNMQLQAQDAGMDDDDGQMEDDDEDQQLEQ